MSQKKTIGVVRFLGTNCDEDIYKAIKQVGAEAKWLWYQDSFNESDVDGVVVPGGFSYGDYLRCGALASKSTVMDSVDEVVKKGKPVLGICNGFQVLCERKLLPGVLLKNDSGKFIDKWSSLNPVSKNSLWSLEKEVSFPIAHGEGKFFAETDTLKKLNDNDQIWLKYSDNPNGSVSDIAGVLNETKNVAGLMPHPERAMAEWMGGADGLSLLERFL